MKITILNGNQESGNEKFDQYIAQLEQTLSAAGHAVTNLTLRQMDLRGCSGCFGCWVKTPGECVTSDDGPQVRRAVIQSDFTLWASPLHMGFPSALLKRTMDKSIPLIHPYFAVVNNEAHHRARYAHYPRLGLVLQKEASTDAEDLRLVTDIFCRTALNMKSQLEFVLDIDQPLEAAAGAIIEGNAAPRPAFTPYPQAIPGVRVSPPQKLTVFNGSPRGKKGNTPLLLDQFLKGFTAQPGRSFEIFHLSVTRDAEQFQQAFGAAECALLGFPLYTDAMPGQVKAFIETLEIYKDRPNNPPLGFFVQSGFPEAAHSRHVEQYLHRLAGRLGSPYLGTIVKGGAEGIQIMPENMTRKLFDSFYQIGKTFAETGGFDPVLLRRLASPERYPAYLAPLFKLFTHLPIASFYWDNQLKQNGAYERRFARPYED